jgi:hypothetical protein
MCTLDIESFFFVNLQEFIVSNANLEDYSVFKTAQFNNQTRVKNCFLLTLFVLRFLHSTEGKTIQPIYMLYLTSFILVDKPFHTLYLTPLIFGNLIAQEKEEKVSSY